jgi:hypothetical protein
MLSLRRSWCVRGRGRGRVVCGRCWVLAMACLSRGMSGGCGDRAAFEADRERDQVLAAAGYRVIRITARQLREQPFAVIARLAGALTQPA